MSGPYTTDGIVRGTCGHEHDAMGAVQCLQSDLDGCAAQGGYSDRRIVRVDGSWSETDVDAIEAARERLDAP